VTEGQSKSEHRIVAIVLAVVAIAALAFAALSRKWLYNPRTVDYSQEVGFGPSGMFECEHEDPPRCTDRSNSELIDKWREAVEDMRSRSNDDMLNPALQEAMKKAEDTFRTNTAFPLFGWIAAGGALLAAFGIFIALLFVIAKKRVVLPIMPTTVSLIGLIVGLFSGCIFVALKPGPAGYVGVSTGFYAFGAGMIAGIASSLMLNKLMRPHDPDLLADAMNPDDFPA
jgi:hypothetical protein